MSEPRPETDALLAVMRGDEKEALRILATMTTEERDALRQHADDLSVLAWQWCATCDLPVTDDQYYLDGGVGLTQVVRHKRCRS